jgi:hypothetical protein
VASVTVAHRKSVIPAERIEGHPNGESFGTAERLLDLLQSFDLIDGKTDRQPRREFRGLTFAGVLMLPLCILGNGLR